MPTGGARQIAGAPASFDALDAFPRAPTPLAEVLDLLDGAEDPYRGLPAILPRLAEPSWYKHVHSGMYHETRKHAQEPVSPAAEKVKRRKARKAQKRLLRAIAGAPTRNAAAA